MSYVPRLIPNEHVMSSTCATLARPQYFEVVNGQTIARLFLLATSGGQTVSGEVVYIASWGPVYRAPTAQGFNQFTITK